MCVDTNTNFHFRFRLDLFSVRILYYLYYAYNFYIHAQLSLNCALYAIGKNTIIIRNFIDEIPQHTPTYPHRQTTTQLETDAEEPYIVLAISKRDF